MRNGFYKLTQHALINVIIKDVNLTDANVKPVPAKVSMSLHAFKDAPHFNLNLDYHSVQEATSCMLPTRLPSIPPTQGSIMEEPFSIWFDTWRRPETLAFTSSLNWTMVLSVTATRTSQAIETSCLLTSTPAPLSLGADEWCSTQVVPSSGLPNFNLRQPYLSQKQSTSPCPWHFVMSFESWT